MTIASEISRLQNDKEAMRQSIINKGVDVAASVSFDDYAACISCIKSGSSICGVSWLAVGGGAAGFGVGGGGGGEVLFGNNMLASDSLCITIGAGGVMSKKGCCSNINCRNAAKGCATTITGTNFLVTARGGCVANCAGSSNYCFCGGDSGSGCKGGSYLTGYIGIGGGGAGAGGNGGLPDCTCYKCYGGNGGAGICGYGGGGGGGGCCCGGVGIDGGGNGAKDKQDAYSANNYGGGGGGGPLCACRCTGNGCQGVVDICYPCNGDFGFTTATGGDSCYVCGDMCVHRFTSNGTFTIVS